MNTKARAAKTSVGSFSLNQFPFVPSEKDVKQCPSAVVPAQAGTHNHQGFGYRWPCHIALLRRMGPRLRGDDSGWVVPGTLEHALDSRGTRCVMRPVLVGRLVVS